MTVLWDAKALQEQRDAIAWLAERSPTAARSLAAEIDRIIRSLAAGEFEGREVSIASGGHRSPLARGDDGHLLPASG